MTAVPQPPRPYTTGDAPGSGNDVAPIPGMLFGVWLATWPRRIGAMVIDFLVTIWLPLRIDENLGTYAAVILVLFNSVFMQSRTTQSLGKVFFRIHTVWPAVDVKGDNIACRVSLIRSLFRLIFHVLDTVFFIGILRPLWNAQHQMFADSITKTIVIREVDFIFLSPSAGRRSSL